MNLEIVNDGKDIEKGPTKRKMSEKQLANLAKGREVKAANAAARLDTRTVEKAEKVAKKASKVEAKAEEVVEPEVRRKRAKQVIVFDDNSESEDEAPKIIIKQKRTQKALAPAAPPTPPPSPPPPPIPKLRRV